MNKNSYIFRFARRLKRYFYALQGKDFFTLPKKNAEAKAFIRLGTPNGGWVCKADKIDHSSTVYSFGVGMDISFDLELIALRNCKIHAFDPSADSADWIQTQSVDKRFCFYAYGLGGVDGELAFRKPNIRGYYSPSAVFSYPGEGQNLPVYTLKTIMKKLGHSSIDLLKIDIEGAEYLALENFLSDNIYPKQLLVEFHHRMKGVGVKKTQNMIRLLLEKGYGIADVSSRGEEFTFIHRS
jgi:FkbM family methyltransferase